MAIIKSGMIHLQNLGEEESKEEEALAFEAFERECLFELDDELAGWPVDKIHQSSDTIRPKLEAEYTIWQFTMGDIEWFPSPYSNSLV